MPNLRHFLCVAGLELAAITMMGCSDSDLQLTEKTFVDEELIAGDPDDDPEGETVGQPEVQTSESLEPQLRRTYWQDAGPIFHQSCVGCHKEGGVGPFQLDNYKSAALWAEPCAVAAQARTMPPWLVTDDGSCGEFAHSLALSDEEITILREWVEQGAPEGDVQPLEQPDLPTIDSGTQFLTPEFMPEIQGGPLAEFDEYRCFIVDEGADEDRFVTGYNFEPGNEAIVHHAIAIIVDPLAEAYMPDADGNMVTNEQRMQMMADESPDRDGWPCFSEAGDGVVTEGAPAVWAPGQGAVVYPEGTGLRVGAGHKIVLQVHYNLAEPENQG